MMCIDRFPRQSKRSRLPGCLPRTLHTILIQFTNTDRLSGRGDIIISKDSESWGTGRQQDPSRGKLEQ